MLFLLHQNTIQSGRQSRDMARRPSVVLLICSVVGLLGLVSAAAGLGAEATRVKGSEVELVSPTQCAYPQSATALGLGLTAVASLLIAHIILNVATGCGCYNNSIIAKTSSNNKTSSAIAIPIACFILSWFTFIVALFFLLTAAVLNERHGEDTVYNGNYYCYIVKPGVFAGGAVLSLTSVILGIIFFYYLTEPIASNSSFFPSQLLPSFTLPNHQPPVPAAAAPRGGSSMAVARPPHRDHEKSDRDHTVFVHEDTYMRRQFP